MSDSKKKPGGVEPEPNGRAFGKYRIINDDRVPGLGGDAPAEGSSEEPRKRPPPRAERDADSVERRRAPDERKHGRTPPTDPADVADRPKRSKDPGARKGSCPSWLKSRVYKGGRPGGNDEGLLELQELVIRNSPVGTAVLDNRGRVRISNESFMQAIGLDDDAVVEDIEQVSKRIEGVNLSDKFWDAVETGSTVAVEGLWG